MFTIITLYAKAARFGFQINSFEFLQELLSRNADIFRVQDDVESNESQELEWIALTIPQLKKRNYFFYKCVNAVMETLSGI